MKRNNQKGQLAKRTRTGGKGFSGKSAPVFNRVPRVPEGEMKYFDCCRSNVNLSAVTTTWPAGAMVDPSTTINLGAAAVATPLCLFAPTVGSALNQRVGRSVLVRKIKVRGQLLSSTLQTSAAGFAPDDSNKVRLMLVQDMQTNAAQMTAAQLMNDAADAATTINSYQNPNNFGRFRVLKDKEVPFQDPNFTVSETAASSFNAYQAGLIRQFKWTVNFKTPVKVQFNATNGGTVADIVDNSFHIVAATTSTTNVNIAISYYSRVAYKE